MTSLVFLVFSSVDGICEESSVGSSEVSTGGEGVTEDSWEVLGYTVAGREGGLEHFLGVSSNMEALVESIGV